MLKGLFFHMIAKVVFVLSTYVVHLFLGKSLTPEEYGMIGVVISIITVNYNFLSNGTRQAVSKLLATRLYDDKKIIKKGFLLQSGVALALTLINFFGAGFFAEILNAPYMANYIRLSAIMIPFTAIYFLCVGTLNGLKMFVIEALIVTVYPMLRLTIIPYISYVFDDCVIGAVMGFFTAAFICCIWSFLQVVLKSRKLENKDTLASNKVFFSHVTSFLLFFTCITVILNADMLIVNARVEDQAYVGYYTGAVNFSKVSYYLLSAVYLVILPTITNYYSQGKIENAKKTIVALNNAIALFILPVATIICATSGTVLGLFYKPDYVKAATATTILVMAQFFIGLFVVINMCISAAQSKKFSTYLALVITAADLVMCYFFVGKWGIMGSALATCLCGGVGCIISYIKVSKIYGNPFDLSIVKLLVSNIVYSVAIYFAFRFIEVKSLFLLIFIYFLLYCFFVFICSITKQVDLKGIINVFTKKEVGNK